MIWSYNKALVHGPIGIESNEIGNTRAVVDRKPATQQNLAIRLDRRAVEATAERRRSETVVHASIRIEARDTGANRLRVNAIEKDRISKDNDFAVHLDGKAFNEIGA